jgi:hypothetical protein
MYKLSMENLFHKENIDAGRVRRDALQEMPKKPARILLG